jgi:hypothetical protein
MAGPGSGVLGGAPGVSEPDGVADEPELAGVGLEGEGGEGSLTGSGTAEEADGSEVLV